MAQVHPFVRPNPYLPYPNFFGTCWQDYWELINWQQKTIQQNTQDTLQVMTHFVQLAPLPSHLYRYMRLNWQKPYIHLSAQTITSIRLLSKLMTQNLCAMVTIQKMLMP